MTFRAFLTNLKAYNEGELLGEWIEFPATDDEITEAFERLHLDEDEEYFFTDYEAPTDIYKIWGEYARIEDLQEYGEILDDIPPEDEEIFTAILDYTDDIDDAYKIYNNNDYIFYGQCSSMADVAEEYLNETGYFDNVPDNFEYYFDYEKYGRDMDLEGVFVDCADGYLEIIY